MIDERVETARRPPLPIPEAPPPGPFRREFWTSPLRGPWLTSFLGSALLPLIVIASITGFLSHSAYDPNLGQGGGFNLYLFNWPSSPAFLYVVTQGLHVIAGLAAIPILLAKLWSVIPKLFEWPPVRSLAHGLERGALALLVGGSLFVFATGVLNIQSLYVWSFSFIPAHYYASFVFLAALALHLVTKAGVIMSAYRERGITRPLRDDLAATRPEPSPESAALAGAGESTGTHTAAPAIPAPPTISRRGLLGVVGAGSLGLALMAAGPVIGGPLRALGVLSPRGRSPGNGPNDFQVNKTAAAAGLEPGDVGSDWRLRLSGPAGDRIELNRTQLLAMPQSTEVLPIACVEGWSTTESWTGVRISELARMAGLPDGAQVFVESIQKTGGFTSTTLSDNKVANPASLLALKVNGADLSLDHGFPARIIVPALPGVRNIKWVGRMSFAPAEAA